MTLLYILMRAGLLGGRLDRRAVHVANHLRAKGVVVTTPELARALTGIWALVYQDADGSIFMRPQR